MFFKWKNSVEEDSEMYKSYKYDRCVIVADQSGMYNKMSDGQLVKGYSESASDKVDDAVNATSQILLKYIEWIGDKNNDFILFGFGWQEDVTKIYNTIFDRDYKGAYYQPEVYKSHGAGIVFTYFNFE
jgi:hypothetical protein